MEQGKRQLQIAGLIQAEVTELFRRQGLAIFNNGMISISSVKVTPDLLEARIYLSFFQVENADEIFDQINSKVSEYRGMLGKKLRNQLRRIPVLVFFKDDTLDHVYKMEALFKQIEEERKQREEKKD